MKINDIRAFAILEFACTGLLMVSWLSYLARRFNLKNTEDMQHFYLFSIKNETHYIKVLTDKSYGGNDCFVLIKPKGFMQMWQGLEQKDVPEIFAEAFTSSCGKERQEKLIGKLVKLKAFY